MKKLFQICIIAAIAIFTSCDVIEPPYTQTNNNPVVTDTVVRKVLLEDYTGHQCPNCPGAAIIAHELMELYPGKISLITIHAGLFANLASPNYMTDFRCTTGNDLNTYFGVDLIGNPNGTINRKEYSGSRIIGPNDWASKIAELLMLAPEADINTTHTFNTTTSTIDLTAKVDVLADFSNPIMISAYLTEDSIVDYQKNNDPAVGTTPEIADYVHMHVLRGSMNGTWGDTLCSGGATVGTQLSKTLSYTVSNASWNKDHMNIVVFIYDAATLEIIQTEEVKLK
ncbi:MAG TPA: Omp28-related outer membrane protein [Bacteroidales bacterium]|nr:Omp28-related outer membrane protein [Bacteroidales bacterium]